MLLLQVGLLLCVYTLHYHITYNEQGDDNKYPALENNTNNILLDLVYPQYEKLDDEMFDIIFEMDDALEILNKNATEELQSIVSNYEASFQQIQLMLAEIEDQKVLIGKRERNSKELEEDEEDIVEDFQRDPYLETVDNNTNIDGTNFLHQSNNPPMELRNKSNKFAADWNFHLFLESTESIYLNLIEYQRRILIKNEEVLNETRDLVIRDLNKRVCEDLMGLKHKCANDLYDISKRFKKFEAVISDLLEINTTETLKIYKLITAYSLDNMQIMAFKLSAFDTISNRWSCETVINVK